MFRVILIGVLLLPLSACFHESLFDKFGGGSAKPVDPAIFTPDLSLETAFDDLLQKPLLEISASEDLQSLVEKLVPRLISHLRVYNNEADLLASSGIGSSVVKPVFKTQSRVYQLLIANSCEKVDLTSDPAEEETIDVRNLENKNSLFWDDADGDDYTSEGDRWIRLLSQCRDVATNRFSTGTIYYTNIYDQVEALQGNTEKEIHDLGVSVRMQIDYDEGPSSSSILFKKFDGLYHRDIETGSHFVVLPGSTSLSSAGARQYALEYKFGSVFFTIKEDFSSVESIKFSGLYFDSELGGYVNIDNLSIDLDYDSEEILNVDITINGDSDDAGVSYDSSTDELVFAIGEETTNVALVDVFDNGILSVIPME